MDALYRGYCGIGTRMPSLLLRSAALRHSRTAGEAPSVMKMFCAAARVERGDAGCDVGQMMSVAPGSSVLQSECGRGERG